MAKKRFWPTICKAYDSLAEEYDLICMEGAGSPGEINLKSADVVNMNMARYAHAKVLLTGDIDRGGVYASFLGTWMTFNSWEKEMLAGFVVNKFRGAPELLASAHTYMLERTGTRSYPDDTRYQYSRRKAKRPPVMKSTME